MPGMHGSRQSHTSNASCVCTARQAALEVLLAPPSAGPAGDRLDRLVASGRLPSHECPLAYELVMGVLRHRLTLTHLLGTFVAGSWRSVDGRVRQVLLLGAYQLLFLDGVPAFAAVSESVELAKRVAGRSAAGFVNALLRRLQREIDRLRVDEQEADPARSIPIDPCRYCRFHSPVLPDPDSNLVDHLALATSHPNQLVARWLRAFGPERTRQICLAGIARPPVVVRPNRLRTTATALAERLRSEGLKAAPDPDGRAVDLLQASALTRTAAFREGLFQPQDRTAMAVVEAMQLHPGDVVIDLCAGLGTKTTQMAESMADQGTVWACDKQSRRLEAIRANAGRLGLASVHAVPLSHLAEAVADLDRIDWILVDAPCSNTGVLARRPEARYRVTRVSLAKLQAIQLELLELATRLARPNTRLAYSTCSLEPEENEDVVALFGQRQTRWRLERTCRIFPLGDLQPGRWHDGGYWALFRPG